MGKNPLATQTRRLMFVCLIICLFVCLFVSCICLFLTNHREESAGNPDNKAHVDAARALEHSRWRDEDATSDDAANDYLDNDDQDNDGGGVDGDDGCGDGDDDDYCASVEKRHFCFETDTLSPCINFKLLICVAEIAVTYYLVFLQA